MGVRALIRLLMGAAVALGSTLSGSIARADGNPYAAACLPIPILAESFGTADTGARWTMIDHPAIANPNGELQAYRADAIATGRQGLRITARRQREGFASGRIASKAAFRYGCFDIVAQMPTGRGLWPALWLRTPYGRPIDGEIDIMEGFGSHPGVFQSTLHRWAAGVHHGFTCTRIGDLRSTPFGVSSACSWLPRWWQSDFTMAPHHYGLIWTPRMLTWLIDGAAYHTLSQNLPDRAMTIQLNLAVGGVFDGNPDATTIFPAQMTVSSITVWPLRPYTRSR